MGFCESLTKYPWNYHDPAPIRTKLGFFNDTYYIRTKLTKLLTKYDDVR